MEKAKRKNIPVILAVGLKVPRWPEYHISIWSQFQDSDFQERYLIRYIKEVVNHYKLVKSLDSEHQIFMTDSGELGLWYKVAKRGVRFLYAITINVLLSLNFRRSRGAILNSRKRRLRSKLNYSARIISRKPLNTPKKPDLTNIISGARSGGIG